MICWYVAIIIWLMFSPTLYWSINFYAQVWFCVHELPWYQGSWGLHGSHLGPTGPSSWAPCWPQYPCYVSSASQLKHTYLNIDIQKLSLYRHTLLYHIGSYEHITIFFPVWCCLPHRNVCQTWRGTKGNCEINFIVFVYMLWLRQWVNIKYQVGFSALLWKSVTDLKVS